MFQPVATRSTPTYHLSQTADYHHELLRRGRTTFRERLLYCECLPQSLARANKHVHRSRATHSARITSLEQTASHETCDSPNIISSTLCLFIVTAESYSCIAGKYTTKHCTPPPFHTAGPGPLFGRPSKHPRIGLVACALESQRERAKVASCGNWQRVLVC